MKSRPANHELLLHGWGRYPTVSGNEIRNLHLREAAPSATLSRGLGRSYGDASLPRRPGNTVASSLSTNSVLDWDSQTGLLRAEAGLTLRSVLPMLLQSGRFVPVSPGTQDVTFGGMIAADVHGKNHHVAGCLGRHVRSLRVIDAAGNERLVDRTRDTDLFRATIGGMGLTGHILEFELQTESIPSRWIYSEREYVEDFGELVGKLREAGKQWPFTVAWADTVSSARTRGRGILIRGRWATPQEAACAAALPVSATSDVPLQFPFTPPEGGGDVRRRLNVSHDAPDILLSEWSMRPYTGLRMAMERFGKDVRVESPYTFFYPLDSISGWNRLYGRRGFIQYQCVVPNDVGQHEYRRLLHLLGRHGKPFLCVIKDCGAEGEGLLSFPRPGVSFALDFPVDAGTQRLVDRLNEWTAANGGRIYLAKDAMSRREHFEGMETRLREFRELRERFDPERRLGSAQSVRLIDD